MGEALDWSDGLPRSRRFDDVYYSSHDGLAESRAVFLAGCGLPEAWAGRTGFTVGELGFGTGLNILALLELWRRTRAPRARLHVFSLEAFPLARADAARALAAWPELEAVAAPMLQAWPDDRQGFHRIDFPADGVLLDLWIGEAAEGLAAWSGPADAWFLDGFAPARNPQMWRQAVLDLVAARSAPAARLATFTVAGAVRRGLEQSGFTVEKRPGFGHKRERLEARYGGVPAAPGGRPATVAVVGGGIAGAALARALGRLGCAPVLVDRTGPGAGASGNPAALVTPRLDAGLGVVAELHAQAFARAVALYRDETPGAIITEGALQLETQPKDAARFARVAAWRRFASGALSLTPSDQTRLLLQEPQAPAALSYREALVIEPQAVLQAWLTGVDVVRAEAASLARTSRGWRLLGLDGEVILEADAVVLAAGPASVRLLPGASTLPLHAVRGQASWTETDESPGPAAAWGGYAIPLKGAGVLFGATHGRGDWDDDVRAHDERRNREQLARGRPALAARLADAPLRNRASLRAATPDHLPLAGAVPGCEGLYVLSGLGGRGFTLAPGLAEHVAAQLTGAPSPLPRTIAAALDPIRFMTRSKANREALPGVDPL